MTEHNKDQLTGIETELMVSLRQYFGAWDRYTDHEILYLLVQLNLNDCYYGELSPVFRAQHQQIIDDLWAHQQRAVLALVDNQCFTISRILSKLSEITVDPILYETAYQQSIRLRNARDCVLLSMFQVKTGFYNSEYNVTYGRLDLPMDVSGSMSVEPVSVQKNLF